jgi:hypothetical protein
MKVEKIVCDICGEVITAKHPLKISVMEYSEKPPKGYRKKNTLDICEKCEQNLPKILKEV